MGTTDTASSLDEYLQRALESRPPMAEHDGRLAPLLDVAARLQGVSRYRLPEDRRRRARAALAAAWLEAASEQARPERGNGLRVPRLFLAHSRGLALAALLTVVLLVSVSITAIAASPPGSLAYPARVMLERVPAQLRWAPQPRASAELAIADRRLTDLDGYLQRTGASIPAAINALLEGDVAAVAAASALADSEQLRVARRVTGHAEGLDRLAAAAVEPLHQVELRQAARRARELAARLAHQPGPAAGQPKPAGVGPLASPAGAEPPVAPAPPAPAGPADTARPPARAPVAATPTATVTPSPTLPAATATPSPTRGMPAASPSHTPVPGRRATALAPTATRGRAATATAEPPATATAPPPEATPRPGRRATALAQTATPPAASATPAAPTPVPGRRATELARTPTAAPPGGLAQPSPPRP